jgi:hypothetical protein
MVTLTADGPHASASAQSFLLRLRLKNDLESVDDRKLAVAELRALSPLATLAFPSPDIAELSFDTGGHEVATYLAARLAFWRSIEVVSFKDNESSISPYICQTQSSVLEATSRTENETDENPTRREGTKNSPGLRKKNEYLSHSMHKYKAKFFPRMARSLINIVSPESKGVILDPFVGSGTTCIEASFMGLDALGFDIDPLSVFISKIKAGASNITREDFIPEFQRVVSLWPTGQQGILEISDAQPFHLPAFLMRRNPKRLPSEQAALLEAEVGAARYLIDRCSNASVRDILYLILSHSIATKISLRWMGTGDDRFALEIASRTLRQIFISQGRKIIQKLSDFAELSVTGSFKHLGSVTVSVGNACCLPIHDNSVDAIVTSPPYLPAASGRETYLRSRAASLIALNLMTEPEILDTETKMIGSILAKNTASVGPLPSSVTELAEWMRPQRERTAKAQPTIEYFVSLRKSLVEMYRVLKVDSLAAIVVSKKHIFYEMKSRHVIREFDMAAALRELATTEADGFRFEHEQTIDLQLSKMDYVARPGARGEYAEAIVIFRKKA